MAKGLSAFGDAKVLAGAGVLVVAGVAFALMTVGALGLAAVALLGAPAGAGLIALGAGLASFGATAGTVGLLGVGVILALSAAFVAFGYMSASTALLYRRKSPSVLKKNNLFFILQSRLHILK